MDGLKKRPTIEAVRALKERPPAVRRSDYFLFPFLMDGALAMGQLMANFRAQDLNASAFQLGLLGLAWGLPFALFSPCAGKIGTRLDRRFLLVIGAALYGVTALLYGSALRPESLICAGLFGGFGCALFWPSFETLLHTRDPKETQARMSLFNVGWTIGYISGSAGAGYLYAIGGSHGAFVFIAALVFVMSSYLAWQVRNGLPAPFHVEDADAPHLRTGPASARRIGYMHLAWLANFTLFYASASVYTLFPKLARSLRSSDGLIGLLLALIVVAQGICFALVARSRRWQYRIAPLMAIQCLGALGLAGLALSGSLWIFAVCLGLIGFSRGLTYSASLFYGLADPEHHGLNSGIHEGIIGVAAVVGPFLSGWVADRFSLRTPFEWAIFLILFGLGAEWVMWRRLPRHEPEREASLTAG
jgi:DHA1 family quinolone resistance protein-like MFS transporter